MPDTNPASLSDPPAGWLSIFLPAQELPYLFPVIADKGTFHIDRHRIPVNAVIAYFYYLVFSFYKGFVGTIIRIFLVILFYAILLSMEELVFGIIGRRIWKYQKDFFE